jgi:hypothetical protein
MFRTTKYISKLTRLAHSNLSYANEGTYALIAGQLMLGMSNTKGIPP